MTKTLTVRNNEPHRPKAYKIHKKIENPFILSFLDYIPYTVLAAMTLPGALTGAAAPLAAGIGLAVGALVAVRFKSLTLVAATTCSVSYLFTLLLPLLG